MAAMTLPSCHGRSLLTRWKGCTLLPVTLAMFIVPCNIISCSPFVSINLRFARSSNSRVQSKKVIVRSNTMYPKANVSFWIMGPHQVVHLVSKAQLHLEPFMFWLRTIVEIENGIHDYLRWHAISTFFSVAVPCEVWSIRWSCSKGTEGMRACSSV